MEEANCCKIEAEKEDGKSNRAVDADNDVDKPISVHGNLRRLSVPTRRSSKAKWTVEEDEILRDAVQKYEGRSWKKIAGCLSGRSDVQCLHRWQKVLNPELVKGPWSKEEDGLLIELVGAFGEKKWSEIAEQLPGRMGKQCRERWYNHLKPEINKAAWTEEEERILINAHAEYGNKWSILAKLLPGRTENSVKNHWNCSLKKRLFTHSSLPPQPNNRGANQDSTEVNQTQNHGTTKTQTQGFTRVDDGDKASPSSECSYTGLWYVPIQREDENILLCSGKFPIKEAWDSYSITRAILRSAASSYRNMPSIIRRRAFRLLQKGSDEGVGPLNGGDDAKKVDDEDRVRTCVFLSQMSEGFKSLQPLNL